MDTACKQNVGPVEHQQGPTQLWGLSLYVSLLESPSLPSGFLCLVTTCNEPKMQLLTTDWLHPLSLFQGTVWLSQLSSYIKTILESGAHQEDNQNCCPLVLRSEPRKWGPVSNQLSKARKASRKPPQGQTRRIRGSLEQDVWLVVKELIQN